MAVAVIQCHRSLPSLKLQDEQDNLSAHTSIEKDHRMGNIGGVHDRMTCGRLLVVRSVGSAVVIRGGRESPLTVAVARKNETFPSPRDVRGKKNFFGGKATKITALLLAPPYPSALDEPPVEG